MLGKLIEGLYRRQIRRRQAQLIARLRTIGSNTDFQPGVVQHPENISVGDHCYIGSDCRFFGYGGITIHDGTIISSRCTIHTTNHRFEGASLLPYDGGIVLRPVVIGEHVWVGDNVMICPGVNIGKCSVVGMGSVVTKDVPEFAIVGGNPAALIRYRKDFESCQRLQSEKKIYQAAKQRGEVRHWDISTSSTTNHESL